MQQKARAEAAHGDTVLQVKLSGVMVSGSATGSLSEAMGVQIDIISTKDDTWKG